VGVKRERTKRPAAPRAIIVKVMPMPRVSEELLAEITRRLVAELDPDAVYLFGSQAWGEPEDGSDVDLLVELSRPMGLFGFFAIQDRLEQLLHCPVDLAEAEALKPRVRERVLREAVVAA